MNANIVGVDITPGSKMAEGERIAVEIGDASDPFYLRNLQNKYQPLIILDDASHIWSHQVIAFEALFPQLPVGGVYICEDIHTSFEPLARQGFADRPVDAFTYFAQLSYLITGGRKESANKTISFSPAQSGLAKSISSITVRNHTVIITK